MGAHLGSQFGEPLETPARSRHPLAGARLSPARMALRLSAEWGGEWLLLLLLLLQLGMAVTRLQWEPRFLGRMMSWVGNKP